MNQIKNDLWLKYLEAEPTSPNASGLIVFIHGRGANEEDLADLAPQLTDSFRVLSVRAPLRLGLKAFAWFQSSYPPTGPIHDVEQARTSLQLLTQFIEEASKKYGVAPKRVFLVGFSQGAILSLGTALTRPELIGGIAALSGRILKEHRVAPPGPRGLQGFPILLSHGTQDEVLTIDYGRDSREYLSKLPVDLNYTEYPMGHDVTEMNFAPVRAWLRARL